MYHNKFTYNAREFNFVHTHEDHIARCQAKGFYEHAMLAELARRITGGLVLDVGAHVGNHSVFFASCTSAQAVCAIEAHKDNYMCLVQNLIANNPRGKLVWPLNMAVILPPDEDWRFDVYTWGYSQNNTGMSTFVFGEYGDSLRREHPDAELAFVTAVTLDSLDLPDLPVTLIKIDVEGGWADVLTSGKLLIEDHKPMLAVEGDKAVVDLYLDAMGWPYECVGTFNATPTHLYVPREADPSSQLRLFNGKGGRDGE